MKYILALIASLFISHGSCQVIDNPHASGLATNASSNGYKVKWNVNPFDQKIFIENQGQFDVVLPNKGKVLFGAELGQIKAFFTANGLTYRYDEYPESKKENEEKEELEPATFLKHKTHYLAFTWEGANPNVTIQALGKRSDYYVYPTGLTSSVQVNLFKKIIYRNLYPGIDIEYIFPDGKEGIKYSIIVHPGGDPSKVKLKYIGAKNIKKDGGNVTIQSEIGEFIDHTPYSFYEGEEGINIQTKYKLNDNEESFLFEEGYDKTKTLVIDPWITTPIFPGAGLKRGPWDVDYDYNGNVYAASQNGLVKLNSSGSIIWTYQVSPVFIIYGEITVDRATGNVFIVGDGGISPSLGIVQKISTNGLLIASNSIAAKPGVMREFWRAAFNQCTNQLIIGAGGLQDIYQAGTIDINLTQFNLVNVMNLPINTLGGYDMVGVSIDPSGTSCYMANSSQSPFNTNTLIKLPCPAISPTSYNQPNGYIFGELNHNYYGSISSNGMNVIAAGNNGVYMWDGYTLKQFNKATGALITSNVIQTPVVLSGHVATRWAGIDVDACEKIYAGYQTSIKVFNSSLLQTNVITLPNNLDTVNDVAIGVKGKTLYACGTSFVTSIEISGPATDSITKATTQATCSCNGTATATFLKCGSPLTSGVTYLWSNGQTTQTATGLCAGIHNITLNYNCKDYRDTVMISAPGNIAVTSSQTNVTCNAGNTGNANVNVSGGLLPYTYSWSGGAGTSPNANNLTAGNYTVTVTDANGCKAIKIVGIDQPDPLIANLATTNNSCSSTGSATLYISNNAPYTYTWSTSQTGTSIGGLIAGTYTLTVNSSNGCSQTKIFN
ncbi:MAG: SprB repeat-containing protein [Bacteroidetes bacterium]|nr:SprB repeat-containing protein [Bacteroidota bacterium]